MQPFVHITYFLQLRNLDKEIIKNIEHYKATGKSRTNNGLTEQTNFTKSQKKLIEQSQTNRSLKKAKNNLLKNFLGLKLFEAFIEAGPQLIFQIMVVLINGLTISQVITISTSALTLTWTASEFFLLYPTKVEMIIRYSIGM